MNKVVKLILICQIKDDLIPQLIPLMWINSIGICFLILLILINLYNLKEEVNLVRIEGEKYGYRINLIW